MMRERGSYMSADIQERWMPHKASLSQSRVRERSSCLPGQAAIRSPPSCQSLQRNGQFTCRTLGQCSRADGTSKLTPHIQEGVCSGQHATHTEEHLGEKCMKLRKQVQTQAYTHLTTWSVNWAYTRKMMWKPLNYSICSYFWRVWPSSISRAYKNTLLLKKIFTFISTLFSLLPLLTHRRWNCDICIWK